MQAPTLYTTDFSFDRMTDVYKGKVRDVYYFGEQVAMVATDRISAFDHILPRAIPYKGQVLNGIAAHFLNATRHIVPNWLHLSPHPNVLIGLECEPIRIEMVVRAYLTGHAWRTYQTGKRSLCGVPLPEGLQEHDRLPAPIITPATKADSGHDLDISKPEILNQQLVSPAVYRQMEEYSLQLFEAGTHMAAKRGLILVDTKYEFGLHQGEVIVIDEVHTPDSSRYFYQEGYEERQAAEQSQEQLSKEFVREWLMMQGFQGRKGDQMPNMPDSFVEKVSQRYIDLYETLIGQPFIRSSDVDLQSEVQHAIQSYFS